MVVVCALSPVSASSETTSAETATSMIARAIAIGRRQLGVGTMRVRAPVPQLRHQSCWAPIGAPHWGQVVCTRRRRAPGAAAISDWRVPQTSQNFASDAAQRAALRARRDAGLAQIVEVAPVAEAVLERAALAVERVDGVELLRDQLVGRAEAALVEHQAAEVAQPELARATQVTHAPTHPPASRADGPVASSRARRRPRAPAPRRGLLRRAARPRPRDRCVLAGAPGSVLGRVASAGVSLAPARLARPASPTARSPTARTAQAARRRRSASVPLGVGRRLRSGVRRGRHLAAVRRPPRRARVSPAPGTLDPRWAGSAPPAQPQSPAPPRPLRRSWPDRSRPSSEPEVRDVAGGGMLFAASAVSC